MNFHSSSYDWLVVSGKDKAKFKGIGTMNGSGDYKFRIWTENGGEVVVYDNGGGDAGQVIGGGSIVIHTK